jgi:hypothetical protein
MPKINLQKSGLIGIIVTAIGVAVLLVIFYLAFNLYQFYTHLTITDFTTSLSQILVAAIQAMFLGIMGWIGSIILLRGVDFIKIDRGVGVVTFRVDKGVGIATLTEDSEKSSPESKEGTK